MEEKKEKKDFINDTAKALMLAMILCSSVCTFVSVFAQFISEDAQTLLNQLSYYFYGWTVFFALGPAVKRNAFMRIDLICKRYPQSLQRILKCVCDCLFFLLLAFMLIYSVQNFAQALADGARNEKASAIPLAAAYAAPIVGYVLSLIAYIRRAFDARKGGAAA